MRSARCCLAPSDAWLSSQGCSFSPPRPQPPPHANSWATSPPPVRPLLSHSTPKTTSGSAKAAGSPSQALPSTEKILELPGLGLGGSIAVDSANGFLYVAEGETVNAYDPLAEHPLTPVYHWTAPGNHELNFTGLYIAVDNSGGPSNGRLYVLNTRLFCGPALYAFEPDGSPAEFTATGGTEIGGL